MYNSHYLIIGSGEAAAQAVLGIRDSDVSGKISLISEELDFPYTRSCLSRGLWYGKTLDSIWKKTERENVTFFLGRSAKSIDIKNRIVKDDLGNLFSYQKLLLATGGRPKQLDCPNEGVIYLRSLRDYYQLRGLYDNGQNFVVIGSGFIGCDIASAFTLNGKKVTLITNEPRIGSLKYPKDFSLFLNALFIEKGVKLILNQTVTAVTKKNNQFIVEVKEGPPVVADGVIAGIGIVPNIELGASAQLEVEDGIVVNRYLQTSVSDVYAAGDVANFYSPDLEKRLRIEHMQAACTMGFTAGKNMAGNQIQYNYLPHYDCEFFEICYEAIGETGSHFEFVEDWHEPYREGMIYFLKDAKLKGALACNIWNQMDRIRKMIASKETFTKDALTGKVPDQEVNWPL